MHSPNISKIRLIVEFALIGLLTLCLFNISTSLDELKRVDKSTPKVGVVTSPVPEDSEPIDTVELHTLAQVNQRFSSINANAKAQDLAVAISDVDSWMIEPKSEKFAKEAIDLQVKQLRSKVISEVKDESQKALSTTTGRDANKILNSIGFLVALYPMSDKPEIIEQARQLAEDQRKLAIKLEGMKRIRYNQWAVIRIEQALNGFHRNSSLWSPKKENKALVDSLVMYLAEVDPNLLEPTVLSLYTYVVETTKESISEADKLLIARRLTTPNVNRLNFEDF